MQRIAEESLERFKRSVGSAPLLIVRLDDFSNALGAGLAEADSEVKRQKLDNVLKQTLHLSRGVTEQVQVRRPEDRSLVPPAVETPDTTEHGAFPAPELLVSKCYVVRLSNHSDRPGPLSLGRATNHDIVLQHSSVSATHAYLALRPELSLRDAASRNGSFVNGVQFKGVMPVHLGDRIKLGAVQMVLCSAADLWHAAH